MEKPVAIVAAEAAPVNRRSLYPEPFASRMAGRIKRRLGDVFGLSNFGVNLTTLAPGGSSALRHAHSRQDEFIYVISGHPTLHTDAGMETDVDATYLDIGDRSAGDEVDYPEDDLQAIEVEGAWRFLHKDGTPY